MNTEILPNHLPNHFAFSIRAYCESVQGPVAGDDSVRVPSPVKCRPGPRPLSCRARVPRTFLHIIESVKCDEVDNLLVSRKIFPNFTIRDSGPFYLEYRQFDGLGGDLEPGC
jgi:hypothetical protein